MTFRRLYLDDALPFRHPSILPKRGGWYVRDWRGTDILPEHERTLCIDLWNPVPDPTDILFPGVWYVVPNLNDASWDRLPWRVPTARELRAFANAYPREFGAVTEYGEWR